jgi:hypothetical protein
MDCWPLSEELLGLLKVAGLLIQMLADGCCQQIFSNPSA